MFLYLTVSVLSIASIIDLITRKIPNYITIPSIISGLVLNSYLFGISGIIKSSIGICISIALLIGPFATRGIGAGDVKLLAVVGSLNGSQFVFKSFLYSAIAGGLMALGIAVFKRQLYSSLMNAIFSFKLLISPKSNVGDISQAFERSLRFPYGVAILFGALGAYFLG